MVGIRFMRRTLNFFCLLFLIVAGFSSGRDAVVVRADGGEDFVPGEVVVRLANSADLGAVAAQHALDPAPLDQFGSRPIYRLRILDNTPVETRVAALVADTSVVFAEPNFVEKPPEGGGNSWSVGSSWSVGGDFGTYVAQWAPDKIHLSLAHQVNKGTGPNGPVKIAVLDTGVDVNHPALAGHLLPGWDFVDNDNDPSEVGSPATGPFGHGTHVAGLIALVAPEAKILPVRVLDEHGVGNIWVLAEALAFAADPDGNPNTPDGADVINMSLSTLRETRLLRGVLAGVCDDTPQPGEDNFPVVANPKLIVVAAAGNIPSSTPEYPAAENIKGLISVGASTQQDSLATFSARGSWVNVAAPGVGILSTVPNGQYATWAGTSMAAPIVAGEAALLRAALPNLSSAKLAQHIEKTSVEIPGDVKFRVDAGAALTTSPEAEPPPSPAPGSSLVQFGVANFSQSEHGGAVAVTLTRTGTTTGTSSVELFTGDNASDSGCNVTNGNASSRCDYVSSLTTVTFAPGETAKTVSIPLIDDSRAEGAENFAVNIWKPVGTSLGTLATATVTINDDDSASGANPADTTGFFVREQYLDFLNRQPDQSGLDFWTNDIDGCTPKPGCTDVKRINVSAAFFLSIEFQNTGYLAYRVHKAAYGNLPGAPLPISFGEFPSEMQEISNGLVVGQAGWEQLLENNKQAFVAEFVSRPRFLNTFPISLTPAQFVDQLFANAAVVPSPGERAAAIAEFAAATNTSDNAARARALRRVAENATLDQQEFRNAFVLMQYFGYLRRNPNAAPDNNFDGFFFWLNKLNQFNGNFVDAEMVKAFIVSIEYHERFGQ